MSEDGLSFPVYCMLVYRIQYIQGEHKLKCVLLGDGQWLAAHDCSAEHSVARALMAKDKVL